MSAGFTPGPYTYNASTGYITAPSNRHFPYGLVVAKVAFGPGKRGNQNGALFAAAPDLLSALEAVRENNRRGVTGEDARRAWQAANAAIAKARGEQS